MDELEKSLKSQAPILRAADAPAQAPPDSAIRVMNKALTRKFKQNTVLTEGQMRFFILRVVGESPLDGFGVVAKLAEHRVELETPGEGIIYGLLLQLESSGALEGRWRELGGAMTKIYHLTEKGSELLQTDGATSPTLADLMKRASSSQE